MAGVTDLTPEFLLANPNIVTPVAPWCRFLDNLDLGILLIAQPWDAIGELRRADLEQRLKQLALGLPLGAIYFQRINRAVAELENAGSLRGKGKERARTYRATPEGFAALILNLNVLRADPTLEGGEFEFKREMTAYWNLAAQGLVDAPAPPTPLPGMPEFFEAVDRVSVLGRPVMTPEVIEHTFDVSWLLRLQRRQVEQLEAQAKKRLEETITQAEFLRATDVSRLDFSELGEHGDALKKNPAFLAVIRQLATSDAPVRSLRAQIARYRAYMAYLNELEATYAPAFNVVKMESFRQRMAG